MLIGARQSGLQVRNIFPLPMRRVPSQLILPAVFFVALAVGLGQYRRVTNDVPHDIDRFRAALTPLHQLRSHDLRFVGPRGHAESLPQARLVMAPTVLHPGDELHVDTTLYVVFPADSSQVPPRRVLWCAHDDTYFYALAAP